MREVIIDAVGAQGDGIVRDGPVFVPLTLPGERATVKMDGSRGELLEILDASPDRVTPPCKHFGDCGGCTSQHWAQQPYLDWKAELIRVQLSHEGIETEILPAFAAPPASRRRVALHARGGKGGVRLGFKERRSWNLVKIEECPVSDPRLVAAFPALARLAQPFLEHPKSAPTLHVTLTATGLDIDITGVEAKSGGLSADARMVAAMAASEGDFARVTLAGEVVYMDRQPLVKLGPALVALSPGSFLQAVPQAEKAMVAFAVEAAQGASKIADLYCGAGTFTFRLAEVAAVHAADASAPAISALKAAIGGAPGLKPITAEARDLVRRPVLTMELTKTDVVVIDPPRAGAFEQTVEIANSKVARVVSVSCNPATFARDARMLVDAGFKLEKVLPVDQFVWSPHIELVGIFSR
ncbi:class I SAM-dependent RNA methyltransferase [Caulobacter sp. DWR1-3-2b1]|uniref:class I SAM-dependent RNA methyltransferase n=1 Tax=Caulobacter sp. DWR1-3-2b1 TaxID=2804670 RepID=UPI003CF9AC22